MVQLQQCQVQGYCPVYQILDCQLERFLLIGIYIFGRRSIHQDVVIIKVHVFVKDLVFMHILESQLREETLSAILILKYSENSEKVSIKCKK